MNCCVEHRRLPGSFCSSERGLSKRRAVNEQVRGTRAPDMGHFVTVRRRVFKWRLRQAS